MYASGCAGSWNRHCAIYFIFYLINCYIANLLNWLNVESSITCSCCFLLLCLMSSSLWYVVMHASGIVAFFSVIILVLVLLKSVEGFSVPPSSQAIEAKGKITHRSVVSQYLYPQKSSSGIWKCGCNPLLDKKRLQLPFNRDSTGHYVYSY